MKTALAFCTIVLLAACEYEGVGPSTAVPVREIHYNYETGERVGTKTFAYDANNNLLYERFVNELRNNLPNDFEVIYERDNEGRLIRRKERYPDVTNSFYVEEWLYHSAVLASEKSYYSDFPERFSEKVYYYTQNRADSAVWYYTSPDAPTRRQNAHFYGYDDQGRLSTVTYRVAPGKMGTATTYRYDGDKTIEECNASRCVFTEYNNAGQVTKIREEDLWIDRNEVNEEYFYKAGRLDEKIVYTHAAYLLPGMVVTWRIKYEY